MPTYHEMLQHGTVNRDLDHLSVLTKFSVY